MLDQIFVHDPNVFEQLMQLPNFLDATFSIVVNPLRIHLLSNVFQRVGKTFV